MGEDGSTVPLVTQRARTRHCMTARVHASFTARDMEGGDSEGGWNPQRGQRELRVNVCGTGDERSSRQNGPIELF